MPLIVTANAAVGKRWAGHAIGILAGISAVVTFLFGALDLAGSISTGPTADKPASTGLDVGLMVTAVVAATLASKPVRERVARVIPADPDHPVDSLALVLAVILFGRQLSSVLFTNVLSNDQSAAPLTVIDLITQQATLVIVAAAGVGLYMRRNFIETIQRVGLMMPAWWHVAMALAAAGAFVAYGQAMDQLSHVLTPQVASEVDRTTQHLFGGLSTPLGIAVLALAPGICEEILFRGALQPRLGLLVTALLFTSIHTQYGLSFDTLSVFVIALGLGAIRKYANTTACAICHVTYNLVVGIGIPDTYIGVTVAVEAVLIAVTAYALWSGRRRP